MAVIPIVARILLYLALSLSRSFPAGEAHTLNNNLSPLRSSLYNSTSFAEPQTLRCYTEEESGFPVDRAVCAPVIQSIYDMRGSSRTYLMKGIACPIIFDAIGTPCQITLVSNTPQDEDRFSKKNVAEVALKILAECDKEKFGGVGILGTRGFAVRVDTAFDDHRRPLGIGRHILKDV